MKLLGYIRLNRRTDYKVMKREMEMFAESLGHEITEWLEESDDKMPKLTKALKMLVSPATTLGGIIVYTIGDITRSNITRNGMSSAQDVLSVFLSDDGPAFFSAIEQIDRGVPLQLADSSD